MTLAALISVALAWFRPARAWAIASGAAALSIFLIFGSGPVSFLLLGSLEFQISPAGHVEREPTNTIVVLAGHAEFHPDHPFSSQLNRASAFRLLESLLLFQGRRDSTVIVSGKGEVATIIRDVIVLSGVPAEQVIVDSLASSTYESAKNLSSRLGHAPFLLVTSAGHMPRAMGAFKKAGANPLAVPTDYMTKKNPFAAQYLPSPTHLHYSDLAISEYVAMMWYCFNGWV
ncbi:MAG: YdcF family protein [Nitrospiraceae bacterium]|nr:YdcF family protein [Nitrospiraceae bacterium]